MWYPWWISLKEEKSDEQGDAQQGDARGCSHQQQPGGVRVRRPGGLRQGREENLRPPKAGSLSLRRDGERRRPRVRGRRAGFCRSAGPDHRDGN